ncbi:hypothetical protein HOT12_gp04 [Burkholderia phage vB_BmuP_KL4]|uniref:Uncharacterized protein n=1 Tax=Burkholderia phage vB_BmuP_KL4 TaxID=2115967 RepID=A0A2S1GNA0_9CAUD|nr:hypothetical protein HOT12_gp04 [Burkholderia phage vB_BmuP_KL4]AWD90850.1 hypothetical protein [Burkholderia phage vB_BmuP_KL4]
MQAAQEADVALLNELKTFYRAEIRRIGEAKQ